MSVIDELSKQILGIPTETFTEKAILAYLNMNTAFDKEQVNHVISNLIRQGKIVKIGKKKYKKAEKLASADNHKYKNSGKNTARKSTENVNAGDKRAEKTIKKPNKNIDNKDILEGVLRGNPKGYAFVEADGEEDLFIPHKSLNGAMHGDTVMVERLTKGLNKPEGRVLRIINRGFKTLVGTFTEDKNFGFVVPDMKEYYNDIFISKKLYKGAKNGDKVVVEITDFIKNKNPEGRVVEILGKSGNPKTDVLAIIRSYGFFETDRLAEKEAKKIEEIGISPRDLAGRTDFTDLLTITIDGDDAKDFDDAISIERDNKGYKLYVHIADVSHYVSGGVIDDEAFKRCTSVYFPGSVFPMIPEALSNGLCSLNEGNVRLTLSCVIELNNSGKVVGYELVKSYIKSNHRMTYNNVTKILNGDKELCKKYIDIVDMLNDMRDLALLLKNKKTGRGAIDFGNNECKIVLDNKYNVVDILPYEYTISNQIIEEFMILANETVAEIFARIEYPFVYRIHETPDSEKLKNFISFIKACGFNLKTNGEVASFHFQNLLNEVKDTEYEKIIGKVMLRTMQKAKYSTINKGHFGLASEYYCHFTSPIRRYPDLMIHRVIKEFLDGKIDKKEMARLQDRCESVATKSTEREIAAEQAERDADDYFKCRFMLDKVGNVYTGTISGVTQFGVFVELDNTVEGMIRFEDLEGNNLEYIEGKYTIKSDNHIYKLGDKIDIAVASVDMDNKKIRFSINTSKQTDKDMI